MYRFIIYIVILLSSLCFRSIAAQIDSAGFIFSIDPPYSTDKKIYQQINYQSPSEISGSLQISCYQLSGTNKVCIYNLLYDVHIIKGVNKIILNFEKNSKLIEANYTFLDVIKKFELLPPGSYTSICSIISKDGDSIISKKCYWNIDSTLQYNSGLRNDINGFFKVKGKASDIKVNDVQNSLEQNQLNIISSRFNRRMGKEGSSIPIIRNNRSFTAFYYNQIFIGYYELEKQKSLKDRIIKENTLIGNDPFALSAELPDNGISVSAGAKSAERKKKKKEEITGSLDIVGSFSNDQEPGSAQDNNYGEIRGDINTEIMNIPVVIEGYYTSQDVKRKAKASYLRVHYDADKAKEKLNKSVSSYKEKFTQSQEKFNSVKALYNQIIYQLKTEKVTILDQMAKEYNVKAYLLERYGSTDMLLKQVDTSALKRNAKNDTTIESVEETKNKVIKDKAAIDKKYQQINAAREKIEKYEALLTQYEEQQYLDSVMAYSKMVSATGTEDISYKKLAKAAENILPEGKARSFLSGLTRLDIGILNSYESTYTMSGQTMKGGSVGYDVGVANLGLSLGKTEYVSRDGNVDKYNSYLARVDFKQIKEQKFALIYYGYSPTRQIISDNNFIKSDIGVPSFQKPVHIISATYEGAIAKGLLCQTEAATSIRKDETNKQIDKDNLAFKTNIAYEMPFAPSTIKGEYEYMGNRFENNSLPYNRIATEKYTLSTQAAFIKSHLILLLHLFADIFYR